MQPTAIPKKAIQFRSCSYGKLPPAAGTPDTIRNLYAPLVLLESIDLILAYYASITDGVLVTPYRGNGVYQLEIQGALIFYDR